MDRPRLLYFADAMCSWCYGFAPEMALIREATRERTDLLLFAGGLRPFTKEPVDARMRDYLAKTWARIGEITGQPFAQGAVQREGFVYDTEPASRAIVTIRQLAPGREYDFLVAIQRAFYAGGADITDQERLADAAEALGIARADFLAAFLSEAMRAATLDDFRVAQRFGIDGFPTLVLHRKDNAGEDEFILIGKGYERADPVLARLEAALGGAPAMPVA